MLFAPALFLVARLLGRRDRRLEATFAVLVILVVAALRFSFAPHDWDLNVRRVTLFRIDSIVWGFLLYLALERRPPSGAERRLRPMAPGRAPRAACGLDPGRARRRDLGRWRRRVGPAGVSLRLGGVRHDLGRRALAGRGPFPQSRRQRRKLLSRPHLVLGLSLPSHHHHGAEADDRRDAARPATGDLCARDPCAVDRLLCRIRAADPGGATLLRRGASRRRGDRRATRRSSPLASLASHRCARDCGARRRRARPQRLHGRQALCVLSALGRDGGSRACARGASAAPLDRRGRGGGARLPFVRARAAVRRRSLSPLDRIAAGRDGRCSRPIPIAPRTPIRPRSRPGGSIISTNGSGTTE